jgi:catechol 2,3-dioxygenase-like lactoylglutathione lyase family enzyme
MPKQATRRVKTTAYGPLRNNGTETIHFLYASVNLSEEWLMEEGPIDARSPLSYVGGALQQVAFVVKDLTAAQEFFNRTMGVARFYVIDDFGLKATEKTFRGRPAEHNFKLALAYSGDTQIELIQHLSGDTCYKEHLERRGEGLHHLGFFLYDVEVYQRALDSLAAAGYSVLMSGRFGTTRYTYFDTEAAIGSIMEIVYLDSGGKNFMAKIKRGDF